MNYQGNYMLRVFTKKYFFLMVGGGLIVLFVIIAIIIISDNNNSNNDDSSNTYPAYVDAKKTINEISAEDQANFVKGLESAKAYSISIQNIIPHPITIQYGPHSQQLLDIYLKKPNEKLCPVIFFIHGGLCDKNQVYVALPSWLSSGYAVVSIDHRFAPEKFYSEMMEDCSLALKWVTDNIQLYGGDPDKIAVTGFSCGAHIAALLVTDSRIHEKYGIDMNRIKCWFPISGFYDMDIKENFLTLDIIRYVTLICTPSKYDASPVAHITGKEPPSLILHGRDDWCVPRTNAISLYTRLKEKGANTQLALLKGYMHSNMFLTYMDSDHKPAALIKGFLAAYLPTEINH
jgi:acetyl esterase/lipase